MKIYKDDLEENFGRFERNHRHNISLRAILNRIHRMQSRNVQNKPFLLDDETREIIKEIVRRESHQFKEHPLGE